jgi:hypothetical protein
MQREQLQNLPPKEINFRTSKLLKSFSIAQRFHTKEFKSLNC